MIRHHHGIIGEIPTRRRDEGADRPHNFGLMNAGGSTFWLALVAALALAGLSTWGFLDAGTAMEGAPMAGTVDREEPEAGEAGEEASGMGNPAGETAVEADVTFSFAEEVVRFESGEYLEQDDLYAVSCRSADGRLKWSTSMDADLIAGVMVDANDDGPREYILVDSRHGIGLDPNGLPIPGFKVQPGVPITSFAVVDYEGDGQERYLFGLSDGRILNHRNLGEATPGWKHQSKGSAIQAIAHLRAGRKDYICTVDEAGIVMLLKRNGQRRVGTPAQLHRQTGLRAVAFEVRADIASSIIISRNAEGQAESRRFGDGVAMPASTAEEQLLVTVESRLTAAP